MSKPGNWISGGSLDLGPANCALEPSLKSGCLWQRHNFQVLGKCLANSISSQRTRNRCCNTCPTLHQSADGESQATRLRHQDPVQRRGACASGHLRLGPRKLEGSSTVGEVGFPLPGARQKAGNTSSLVLILWGGCVFLQFLGRACGVSQIRDVKLETT